MAGIVERLFGPSEKSKLGDEYINAAIRGVSPVGLFSGLTDLAALPLTATGLLDPKNVVGGSKQMEGMGALPPAPESLRGQTVEAMTGLFSPMAAAGAFGRQAPKAISQLSPGPQIRQSKGQAVERQTEESTKDLITESQVGRNPKFLKRVTDFKRAQSNDIEMIARKLQPNVKQMDDPAFAERVQDGWRMFMDAADNRYKAANSSDFDKALAGGRSEIVVPRESGDKAFQHMEDWISTKLRQSNIDPGDEEALTHLYSEAERLFKNARKNPKTQQWEEVNSSLGTIKDNLAYSVRDLAVKDADNPFSKAKGDWTKQAQRELDQAMKIQLEDAAKTIPEAQDLITARKNFAGRTAEHNLIKDQTLVKFFGLKDVQELETATILNKLKKMDPKQRAFFNNVSKTTYPEIAEQLRRRMFDDVVDAGIQTGKSDIEGGFNQRGFLKAYEDLPPDLQKVIEPTNPAAKAEWDNMIEETRKSLRAINMGQGKEMGIETLIEGAAAAKAGVPTAIPRGITGFIDSIKNNRESVYRKHFGADKSVAVDPTSSQGLGGAVGASSLIGREATQAIDPNAAAVPQMPSEQPVPFDPMSVLDTPDEQPSPEAIMQKYNIDPKDLQDEPVDDREAIMKKYNINPADIQ